MDTPVIGITTASLAAFEGVTSPQPDGSVVGNRYVQAVVGAGALPWPLPVLEATSAVEALYRAVDGLVLAGGSDIRPAQYGADPGPHLDRGDPRRDELERILATWAWRDGKPVLGVCRGMQMLNVSRGGTLIQDLATDGRYRLKHDYHPMALFPRDRMAHLVTPEPGSLLERLLGGEPISVNSIHHQAVDRVGAGLVVAGRSTDGVVEALEAPGHPFFMGVQWHPEEFPAHRYMRTLFQALVTAARTAYRSRMAPALPVAG